MVFVIPTQAGNVAFNIALSVLLLSVVLHPIVKGCFYRLRADMAWRKMKTEGAVEVTKYSIFSETLGDRGRWDTARLVTFLLAGFHVATWGLELSLDLALRTDGPVDLLNRPPPVTFASNSTNGSSPVMTDKDWLVLTMKLGDVSSGGVLGNFRGTLEDGNATATYRVGDEIIRGNTLSAWWSSDSGRVIPGLFYDENHGSGRAKVDGVSCSNSNPKNSQVFTVDSGQYAKWGSVSECDGGPLLWNDTGSQDTENAHGPPTLILTATGGNVSLVVEEASSYPSFLYSVWTTEDRSVANGPAELALEFYVATTTRLAEAIVSGVVNGAKNGGSCVDLLSQFSKTNSTYGSTSNSRVEPFGERPFDSTVASIDIVEPIVAGVLVNNLGTVCGILLFVVTAISVVGAVVGCLCCRSQRPLDVYDRDQLIRAVSMPSDEGADGRRPALKIYVRREKDNNEFSIVISDDGVYRGLGGLRKRVRSLISAERRQRSASVGSSTSVRSASRSGSVPQGSRALSFTGVRPAWTGEEKPYRPPARRTSRVVALTASPVPQSIPSLPFPSRPSPQPSPPSLGVLSVASIIGAKPITRRQVEVCLDE